MEEIINIHTPPLNLEQYKSLAIPQKPFEGPLWLQGFIRHIPDFDQERLAILFTDNKKDNLFFPITIDKSKNWFGIEKTIRPVANYYSPTLPEIRTPSVLSDEACHFFKEHTHIHLAPLSLIQMGHWRSLLTGIGFKVLTYDHNVNWKTNHIESQQSYWNSRGSKLLNTIRRKEKKARSVGDLRFQIFTPDSDKDLQRYLIDYHIVYAKSWKQQEPYPGFIDYLCKTHLETGKLRIGIAYLDGSPVAAQLWFVSENTAYIYKLAYDEEYKPLSIGTQLTQKLVDHVLLQDHVTEIDFLTGDDNYKKDWMDVKTHLYGIVGYNTRTMSGRISYYWERAKRCLKSLV